MKKRKKERKTKRMNASRQTTHSKIKKWDFAVCLVMASGSLRFHPVFLLSSSVGLTVCRFLSCFLLTAWFVLCLQAVRKQGSDRRLDRPQPNTENWNEKQSFIFSGFLWLGLRFVFWPSAAGSFIIFPFIPFFFFSFFLLSYFLEVEQRWNKKKDNRKEKKKKRTRPARLN